MNSFMNTIPFVNAKIGDFMNICRLNIDHAWKWGTDFTNFISFIILHCLLSSHNSSCFLSVLLLLLHGDLKRGTDFWVGSREEEKKGEDEGKIPTDKSWIFGKAEKTELIKDIPFNWGIYHQANSSALGKWFQTFNSPTLSFSLPQDTMSRLQYTSN